MERGEGLPVFELDNGLRLGILTCYDGWFPEPARALSLQGAEMIVWINGRGGSVEDFIVQATMFQSHVAMVTTNQACESTRSPVSSITKAQDTTAQMAAAR